MGDAIDDYVVGRGFRHPNFPNAGQLGLHIRVVEGVDLVDQRGREGRLHAENDSDFFHGDSLTGDTKPLRVCSLEQVEGPNSPILKRFHFYHGWGTVVMCSRSLMVRLRQARFPRLHLK